MEPPQHDQSPAREELAALRQPVVAVGLHDVTAEKLRDSEEKYRMLIEACPDAVVVADLQMQIVFASQQAVRIYGAESPEEICGRNLVSFVVEEERSRAIAATVDLFRTGLRREVQYTFTRKDGTRFPCEVSTGVIHNSVGEPAGLISVVRDISERIRNMEQLRKEREVLEQLLQASDHDRQIIAYEIHDGLAQQLAGALMQFQTFTHLRAAKPELAETALEAGMTLLQQSHFEARRLIAGVRPPILDESGVVEAIAHLIHEEGLHHGPRIEFLSRVHFRRLSPILENAIYRIVQEGLSNARKHSKSKRIRVSLRQKDGRIHITIRDWGVGLRAADDQVRGYGLKGIRQRVRLLGGYCRIVSGENRGTCVRVALPLLGRE